MKILNILKVLIIIVVLFFALLFSLIGLGVVGGISSVVSNANQEVIQTVIHEEEKVKIIVPLYENLDIRYDNLHLCTEKEKDPFFDRVFLKNGSSLSSSKSCSNEQCTVSINIKSFEKLPKNLYIYSKNKMNKCEKIKYPVKDHIVATNYTSTIEFTDVLKQALNLANDEEYQVMVSHSNGTMVYQIMGTKKINISYNQKRDSDDLLINSIKKAEVLFQFVPNTYRIIEK